MGTFELVPHPDTPPLAVIGIEARMMSVGEHWLTLRWRIDGAERLVIPPFAGKGRADGLWQATCFELFVQSGEGPGYTEFNLSPSERWAVYDFSDYRAGMANRPLPRDPGCTLRQGHKVAIFDAAVPLVGLPPRPWRYGLSAVIEEEGGTKSCWALAHPPGQADFHHPACFAATLAAPQVP